MKTREFWFVVGSQFLYGPEVLETVEARAKEMAEEMSKKLPYPLVFKTIGVTCEGITNVIKEANYHAESSNDDCKYARVADQSDFDAF